MSPEERIRGELVKALEADLVGPFDPSSGDEVLPLPPTRWYLTGFLAPRGGGPETELEEGELAAGSDSRKDDAGDDEPEPKRRQFFPASLGLSVFLPPGQGDSLEVEVRYADYERETVSEDVESKQRTGWRRVPRNPPPVRVPLDRELLAGSGVEVPEARALKLYGELRETTLEGLPPNSRVLSLFLVNERQPLEQHRDLSFVFQVSLGLHYKDGFLSRPNRRGEGADEDDPRVLALQYRNHREWAVGHNTSLFTPKPDADGVMRELHTTQLPRYEVRKVSHEAVAGETSMKRLYQLDDDALTTALEPLAAAYAGWIERQSRIDLGSSGPGSELEQTRDTLIRKARLAETRIREGIALLGSDGEIREAFRMANYAMHVQAEQADRHREKPRYSGNEEPRWRPFQLAFVLLNLASVADPEHRDRQVADLIYFPTGGGKTEAYLGLIAFTLILRRLRGKSRPDEGRGVAVILRYTLRLLTLDQLGRAATLICALEELRYRRPKKLGNTRFTVGLWVGGAATANRLSELHKALNDHQSWSNDSPFPLSDCPWCNKAIKKRNIKLLDAKGQPNQTKYVRAVVYCDGADCRFSERHRSGQGLPVLFVDDQIYEEVPDFLVATVDKFALMPWRGEAGMLFGRATHVDAQRAYGVMHAAPKGALHLPAGLRPPELIVQDELHLISGPLGTMVGLYESAVDFLASHDMKGRRRPPKIVCSTATVRRAREQVRALFQREMALFPPRGVNDDDNFFATTDSDNPGRLYVGVAAPGRALRTVSVRTYAALLAAAQKHFNPKGQPEQPVDPYMTLVGYFNSLRELGGMRRLVEDEVRNRVRNFTLRRPHHFVGAHPWAEDRTLLLPEELTSRESTEKIKTTKQRLARRRAAKGETPGPLDTVLASSMISVGLDVDRLGLMVVTGQPKTTSEYIQATSRVGRADPGLVVTCFNAVRPRDRSHYERFVAYHESFYREVEATSVTPFSRQTLDRGMAGVLMSMIRHGLLDMSSPTGFMRLRDHRQAAEEMLEELVHRGREHREWHDTTAEQRIENGLRARGLKFLDVWDKVLARASDSASERRYSPWDHQGREHKAVLHTVLDPPENPNERRFAAPTSMRDVEPNSHLWLRFAPLDGGS